MSWPHLVQHNQDSNTCLFDIVFTQLFTRSSQRLSSNQDCFVYTQLHIRLTELLLLTNFVLPHNSPTQTNERSLGRAFLFSPLRELYCNFMSLTLRFCYLSPYTHTDVVIGLIITSLMYTCISVTNTNNKVNRY